MCFLVIKDYIKGSTEYFFYQFSIDSSSTFSKHLYTSHALFYNKCVLFNKYGLGNSLVVQWLRLCASAAEGQVQSLVGELRSHKWPKKELN